MSLNDNKRLVTLLWQIYVTDILKFAILFGRANGIINIYAYCTTGVFGVGSRVYNVETIAHSDSAITERGDFTSTQMIFFKLFKATGLKSGFLKPVA